MAEDIVIQSAFKKEQLAGYLFELCHEWARPNNLRVNMIIGSEAIKDLLIIFVNR